MVTATSADAVTLVVAVSVLFPGTGSGVADEIDAELVREVGWPGAVTTIVKVVDAPDVQLALVQVTEAFPALVQDHPPFDGVTDTNVTPAGRVSTTLTDAAVDGPRLSAVTVYETAAPAATFAGPVLVTDKSADAVTLVVT